MITFKTLTPLWTGDADRNCTELKESGILGSLRWWAEAVLVALGAKVCDPLDTKCEGEEHCAACHLFGCTGWRKRFRLNFHGAVPRTDGDLLLRSSRKSKAGNYLTWSLPPGLKSESLAIDYIPLIRIRDQQDRLEVEDNHLILRFLFTLIGQHGGLGANQAKGFGAIQLTAGELQLHEIDAAIEALGKLKEKGANVPPVRGNNCPNLREMFFWKASLDIPPAAIGGQRRPQLGRNPSNEELERFRAAVTPKTEKERIATALQFDRTQVVGSSVEREFGQYSGSENFVPTAFAAREAIRGWFRHHPTLVPPPLNLEDVRHFYCGAVAGQRTQGAKILASHTYQNTNSKWEFRVWGWLPNCGTVLGPAVSLHLQRRLNDPNWLIHRTLQGPLFKGLPLIAAPFLVTGPGESGEDFLKRLLA